MKILLVSSYLPYPLYSGGQVRLYNIIKEISKKHEVTLICEKRDNQTEEDIRVMEKICKKVVTVRREKQWSFQNIVKTGFSSNPFLITGHTSSGMKKKINDELKQNKFDLIHIETFYVMQNVPKYNIPLVLVEHNIEYLVYKRYADKAPVFVRPLLYLDVEKMKLKEKKAWQQATKLVAVSGTEKKLMDRGDVVVVPNGVDTEKYQISSIKYEKNRSEITLLYIGDFKWIQNKVAAKLLLTEIWPRIISKLKNKNLNVKLWVVGRKIPDEIKKMGSGNVVFDENAPDTSKVYEKSDILIAPIIVGGGTSFKILEAMTTGVAVVTTDLGIEGIEAKDKEHFLLGNNPDSIAENVITLIDDTQQRINLIKNARELMERKYNWQKITDVLESVYKSAI